MATPGAAKRAAWDDACGFGRGCGAGWDGACCGVVRACLRRGEMRLLKWAQAARYVSVKEREAMPVGSGLPVGVMSGPGLGPGRPRRRDKRPSDGPAERPVRAD